MIPEHPSFCSRGKRNKKWKHRVSFVLLVTFSLLGTCAWPSFILLSRVHCKNFSRHRQQSNARAAFPWEPGEEDQNYRQGDWALPLNTSQDLKLRNILFGIAGSAHTWPGRKQYVKLWWRPQEMRGYVWLEEKISHQHDSEQLPMVMVYESISKFSYTNPTGHPSGIRIARIVQEAFKLRLPDVKWFVMGDDDTLFSPENLVHVLQKYDPRELYYIGNPSESHSSNTYFSHGMAFGGGGIAISHSLAEALTLFLDDCLERYPFLFGSDDRLHSCITELGVPLTKEIGFHQFDIHGNAFGLLAAHPIAPFVSLHHMDEVNPVFPKYNATEGLQHLVKAMQAQPSNFLQRCICYDHGKRLTISISSGFVVQVYPSILLPRELEKPELTFKAWNKKSERYEFDLDTRAVVKSICSKPLLFFWEHSYLVGVDVISLYKRDISIDHRRKWSFCFPSMLIPEDMQIFRIVSKTLGEEWFKAPRRQCCKLLYSQNQEVNVTMGLC